jgi:hypothetical protein
MICSRCILHIFIDAELVPGSLIRPTVDPGIAEEESVKPVNRSKKKKKHTLPAKAHKRRNVMRNAVGWQRLSR